MADPVLVADAVDAGELPVSGPQAAAAPCAATLVVERAAHALPFAHAPPGVLS